MSTAEAIQALRTYYGSNWLLAVAEHWEQHNSLAELREHVRLLEACYDD